MQDNIDRVKAREKKGDANQISVYIKNQQTVGKDRVGNAARLAGVAKFDQYLNRKSFAERLELLESTDRSL